MKKPGFWQYYRAAFNARPKGMFVSPNWAALAAFGILGLLNPGLWLIGGASELAYLTLLANNRKFRGLVDTDGVIDVYQEYKEQLEKSLTTLSSEDQQSHKTLEEQCRRILAHLEGQEREGEMQVLSQGFGRLLLIHIQLLQTRHKLMSLQQEGQTSSGLSLERRIQALETRLAGQLDDHLRQSLSSQLDILKEREKTQTEARGKMAFLEAEIVRIREQVELVREQTMVSSNPEGLSQKIDSISAVLDGTTEWLKEQQQLYTRTEDLIEESVPVRGR
jgi:hypothetical protein